MRARKREYENPIDRDLARRIDAPCEDTSARRLVPRASTL